MLPVKMTHGFNPSRVCLVDCRVALRLAITGQLQNVTEQLYPLNARSFDLTHDFTSLTYLNAARLKCSVAQKRWRDTFATEASHIPLLIL